MNAQGKIPSSFHELKLVETSFLAPITLSITLAGTGNNCALFSAATSPTTPFSFSRCAPGAPFRKEKKTRRRKNGNGSCCCGDAKSRFPLGALCGPPSLLTQHLREFMLLVLAFIFIFCVVCLVLPQSLPLENPA